MDSRSSPKSASVALLLCLFFGFLGAHRFYVGKIGTGILMLLTLGGFGIWTLVDIISMSICEFKDKNGKTLEFKKVAGSPTSYILKTLGIIIGTYLVLFFLIIGSSFLATSGMVELARNQLDALSKGDMSLAYSYTSKDFQKGTSLEEFQKFVNQHPELTNVKSSSFNYRKIGSAHSMILGTIYSKDGTETPIEFVFVKEDGAWKIYAFVLNPSKQDIQNADPSSDDADQAD